MAAGCGREAKGRQRTRGRTDGLKANITRGDATQSLSREWRETRAAVASTEPTSVLSHNVNKPQKTGHSHRGHTFALLALRRGGWEDCEFEASFGCVKNSRPTLGCSETLSGEHLTELEDLCAKGPSKVMGLSQIRALPHPQCRQQRKGLCYQRW